MRNLKKVLAVICAVAMMVAMLTVPALAAGYTYEDEATALNTLGVMNGMNLGDKVTRIQGLTFAIKIAGKDADAQALTDAEVAEILEDVVDADEIPDWGRKYAAYAVANGFTSGTDASILPQIRFSPMQIISGDSFLYWILYNMGYTDIGVSTAWETAATDADTITLSQGVIFHGLAELTRDDVAGILYGAVENGVKKDGTALVDFLISAGLFTQEDAAAVGLADEPDPTAIAVASVSATNLMEVTVVFNSSVDKDSLDTADFDVDGETEDSVALQDDGVTVIVKLSTPMDNESSYDIKIKEVKGVNGTEIAETTLSFETKDYSLPQATNIEFTGPQSAKITFSEPISQANSGAAEISVDNGIYMGTVDSWDGSSVSVDFGTELTEGAHSILVKNFADYVPYTMISKTFNVTYAKVATAPVASASEVKQTYVKIKFDRPVKGVADDNFYQTYSSWKPLEVQDSDGNVITSTSNFYSEIKLVFANGGANDRPLPVGTTNVVIVGDKLEDKWGNKIKSDVVLSVSVTADTEAPSVSKITVESQSQIKIYFNEDLNATEAGKESVYKIVNPDGDTLKSYDFDASYTNSNDEYIVTINFDSAQDPGSYTITIDGIKDASLAANLMPVTTLAFTITDKSPIDLEAVDVTAVDDEDILYVKFPEAVATTGAGSALEKSNYLWDSDGAGAVQAPAKLNDNCKISLFTSKIVKIQFPAGTHLVDSGLVVGRIADSDGNLPTIFSHQINDIAEEKAPVITAIKKIDENKYELTVDQELKSVKVAGIKFDLDNTADPAAEEVAAISYVNDGNKTKITITVKASGRDPGTEVLNVNTAVISTVTGNIKGVTGVFMASVDYPANNVNDALDWQDGMAPKVAKDADDDYIVYGFDADGNDKLDHIVIGYTENIADNTISKYTYAVAGYTVTAAGLSDGGDWAAVKADIGVTADSVVDDGSGKFVVLTIKEGDNADDDATPGVTQKYAIEDTHGNEKAPADAIEMISVAEAATK